MQKLTARKNNTGTSLPMLLYQGALSFEIWTKQEAPIEVMRQCLRELIAE